MITFSRAGKLPPAISLTRIGNASWRFAWGVAVSIALFSQAMADTLQEQTEIRYQGWAGQVTFVELADDLGYLAPLKLKWVGNTISGPQDIQTVVTGDTDIGGAFYGAQADCRESPRQSRDRVLRLGCGDLLRLLRQGRQPNPDRARHW